MEILLLVQKWCNASSNTKNSKKKKNNKSSTLSLLKIPAPSLICLTEKPKKIIKISLSKLLAIGRYFLYHISTLPPILA